MIFFEPQHRDRAHLPHDPFVGFSSEGEKDSQTFAVERGEFVWSMATYALREQMSATSAPLARCGYDEYTVIDRVFSIARPEGAGNAFGN